MRTERQLGYLVGSGYLPYNQHPGIALYIQSPNYSAEQLIAAMRQFLSEFSLALDDFQAIWPSLKAGVIRQLSQTDSHLSMKSQRLWMSLGNKDFEFSQNAKLVCAIKQLAFSQLIDFNNRLLMQDKFSELILISSKHTKVDIDPSWQLIPSVNDFKKRAKYFS
jgi:secreted Zn-dependent insulinase-like peptidase